MSEQKKLTLELFAVVYCEIAAEILEGKKTKSTTDNEAELTHEMGIKKISKDKIENNSDLMLHLGIGFEEYPTFFSALEEKLDIDIPVKNLDGVLKCCHWERMTVGQFIECFNKYCT